MKRIMVAMTLMGAALILGAGVAWAATVNCQVGVPCEGTDEPAELIGTNQPDTMNGLADDDLLEGFRGPDEMFGDHPERPLDVALYNSAGPTSPAIYKEHRDKW